MSDFLILNAHSESEAVTGFLKDLNRVLAGEHTISAIKVRLFENMLSYVEKNPDLVVIDAELNGTYNKGLPTIDRSNGRDIDFIRYLRGRGFLMPICLIVSVPRASLSRHERQLDEKKDLVLSKPYSEFDLIKWIVEKLNLSVPEKERFWEWE